MMGLPTVAIIGRPNVGKSTLFNRIIGGREAIVDARPGVTRDRHFARAEWNGKRFWLVDTGGLVPGATDALNRAIRTQIELAIAESDLLLFLVDVEQGVHPADLEIAQYLRHAQRPVLLVANKADHLPDDTRHLAFYELGLGDPFPVSAAVGKASGDLLDQVVALLPAPGAHEDDEAIHVAVVGRPTWENRVSSTACSAASGSWSRRSRARRVTRSTRRSHTTAAGSCSSTPRACASAARWRTTSSSTPRSAAPARSSAPTCASWWWTRSTACTCRTSRSRTRRGTRARG